MHTSTIQLLSTLGLLGTVLGSSNSFPGSNVDIDTRSLDDIYEAAKLESGPLRICWGGDGIKLMLIKWLSVILVVHY